MQLSPSSIDPAKIFLQADGFLQAFVMISDGKLPVELISKLGAPAMVLSAFSSELFLKCLICIETGRVPRGHDLKPLFDKLSPGLRNQICDMWDVIIVPKFSMHWDRMERHVGAGKKIARDLPGALKASHKSFERIRYAHEGGMEDVEFSISHLPFILQEAALELRPAWRFLGRPIQEIPD